MARPDDDLVRTLATFGLAVGGPVSLAAGVAVLATVTTGTPSPLVAVLLFAVALTVLSWLVFVIDDLQRRRRSTDDGGAGPPLSGGG
jgi:hypothetical protein